MARSKFGDIDIEDHEHIELHQLIFKFIIRTNDIVLYYTNAYIYIHIISYQ